MDKDLMTPERILQLAQRPDGFVVTWRYRDEWLQKRCIKLKRAGVLRSEKARGATIYFATSKESA